MFSVSRVFPLLLLLLFQPSARIIAEEKPSVEKELKEVKAQVEEGEKKLAAVRGEKTQLQYSKSVADAALAELARQERDLLNEIETTNKKLANAEAEVERAQESLSRERAALENLARGLYRNQRRSKSAQFLFEADSPADFVKRVKYIRVGAIAQGKQIERYRELLADAEQREFELKILQAERETQLRQTNELRNTQEEKNRELVALIQQLDRKEKLQTQLLRKLSSTAKKLEKILAGLMDSPEQKKGTALGVGLASLKGKLRFPVAGRLVQGFGKQRHEEFSDFVVVKGVEVESPSGSEVRPISAGKVVAVQALPGLGNVVVVDHGARYYSLYGRLSGVGCANGQDVLPETVLGTVGEPDYRGRNFYFELRYQGKAVDPTTFFTRLPPKG